MTAVREAGTLDSPANEIRDFFRARAAAADVPDGFVCPGEVSALALVTAMGDAGRVLAEDYDIVAKETSHLLTHLQPKIDTIYEDLVKAGEHLGQMLLQRISNPAAENETLLLPPQINFPVA
jgi:LacI family transcriptional regulator